MADEKKPTETLGPVQGPFTLTCSGTFTTGASLIITDIKQTDWICPECKRTFHRTYPGPDCPICKVALQRTSLPGRVE